jgi:hypothetical protein
MGRLPWALLGAAGATYLLNKRRRMAKARRELDGLCAVFPTRAGADLAVEHLVQEYGIDGAFIYVEPVAEQNSAGLACSGGDAASGAPGHGLRPDAPLNGAIQLTVPVQHARAGVLTQALREAGATQVESF